MAEELTALAPDEQQVAPAAETPPAETETPPPEAPAEPAPAEQPPGDTPDDPKTQDSTVRRGQNRLERRIAAATRKFYEEKARADLLESQLKAQQPKTPAPGAPRLEQFSDIEEYATARENWAREHERKQIVANQQATQAKAMQERIAGDWETKADKGASKYDDFQDVVGDLQPTTPWAVAIMQADNAEDVAYYLGKHQAEARRIMALDPIAQMREVGKLEAKLLSEPTKPKMPSKAPAPIAPVGGKSGGASDIPLDSDDIQTWMLKENARMRKLAGA